MSSRPKDYIGKIVVARFPYFDMKTKSKKFKGCPSLVIGCESERFPCDFVVLPVSKIQDASKRHPKYDHQLDELECQILHLKHAPSFIRCHKVTTVHSQEVKREVLGDISANLPIVYKDIETKFTDFSKSLFS
ncbi:hypothetical protein TP70_08310 [Staphylococcus microti]|uniref:Phage protein n=1 Tax=Staphylococcus microti TaxID=569857 RepID=A0A0D6XR67_9STAP|nr:type II toxin-antitoxin system PemK/MazF family toxin [Staphylococcus microti]KIX90328.1 hypothetical protein TP70_08310 [Staphylococcus microti]PNZ80374.1 hypothetical protein CD132_08050 [Staphylococcus microti]SUM56853.1 phage protein [Staphylococcus microti]